jgi:hypothetical protein
MFTITNFLDFQIIDYLILPFSDYGYLISLILFMSVATVAVTIIHLSTRRGVNALVKGAGYGFGLTAGHRAANILADSLEGKSKDGSNNSSGDSGSNSGSDNSKDSNNSKDSGSDKSKDSGSDKSKDSGSDKSTSSKSGSNNSTGSNSGSENSTGSKSG